MESKGTVSVLMSVYNTDFAVVKRAIDSVLNQDFPHFELIILDDGSDNDPGNKLLQYAQKHQDKIIYIRLKNGGQSKAINRGVLNSTGQFVTILDADDEYKTNHLRTCMAEMKDSDLIASTTQTIVDSEAEYYVPDRMDNSRLIHVDDCILFATLFGRKEVFESVHFMDRFAADAHFYELVAEKYRVKKVDLRTYIYYRNNQDSVCSVLKKKAVWA